MELQSRLVTYHLGRLSDPNPDVRLKSIAELEQLGDATALDALEQLYKNDRDARVRKAAQAAGRAIYLKGKQGE